jgi:2-hydroxy-3-oxopropionate reductase
VSISKIALLGTGLMGGPMARRLLAAGLPVTLWNRSRDKADALAPFGAKVAASAKEAAAEADFVITMLDSGPVVTEVVFGQGVAEALPQGSVLIDMSSIPPSAARDHAAKLAAGGRHHLDAPVSGGTAGAEAGTLAIMAGGPEEVFERALPVFAPMGRAIRVGPSGAGQISKLANQAIVGITIGAVAEALLLAQKGGADPGAVRDAIRGGFAESRILDLHGKRMVDREFTPGAKVTTQIKDLETILATADQAGLEMPLTKEVYRRYLDLRDRLGGGALDHAALFLQLETGG